MNKQKTKRRYQMSKRAESTAQTANDIYKATTELWHTHPIANITLDVIAERANVSVRTIIRRYGSKEGLFKSCIQNAETDISSDREKAQVGDVDSAIHYLLADYETHGDALVRTLAVEDQIEVAHEMLQAGRSYHREWCSRIFEPFLPEQDDDSYAAELNAFVAATEFYIWKLLRRDMHHTLGETEATFKRLVNALIPSN